MNLNPKYEYDKALRRVCLFESLMSTKKKEHPPNGKKSGWFPHSFKKISSSSLTVSV